MYHAVIAGRAADFVCRLVGGPVIAGAFSCRYFCSLLPGGCVSRIRVQPVTCGRIHALVVQTCSDRCPVIAGRLVSGLSGG